MKLLKSERISLKNSSEINEAAIQKFIFDDPTVLGLGDLIPISREKIQPAGGRLDILLGDDDGNTRYEVEVQLGKTDESHIIRTIEYWDTEKKRYPQYDHCAVIVAEDFSSRFMNVISLFNGSIPLIALQIGAYKQGNDLQLVFTKVLDRLQLGTDEEDQYEVADKKYWLNRSTTEMINLVEKIYDEIQCFVEGYTFKYNKYYITLAKNGVTKNFIMFRPKKNFLSLVVRGDGNSQTVTEIENAGIQIDFYPRWNEIKMKINKFEDYKKNKTLIDKIIMESKDYTGA